MSNTFSDVFKTLANDSLGFRGLRNVTAWGVALGCCYIYVYMPMQAEERQDMVRLLGYLYRFRSALHCAVQQSVAFSCVLRYHEEAISSICCVWQASFAE